jgi:hypothetical protein
MTGRAMCSCRVLFTDAAAEARLSLPAAIGPKAQVGRRRFDKAARPARGLGIEFHIDITPKPSGSANPRERIGNA